jgi:hypothetical protein
MLSLCAQPFPIMAHRLCPGKAYNRTLPSQSQVRLRRCKDNSRGVMCSAVPYTCLRTVVTCHYYHRHMIVQAHGIISKIAYNSSRYSVPYRGRSTHRQTGDTTPPRDRFHLLQFPSPRSWYMMYSGTWSTDQKRHLTHVL